VLRDPDGSRKTGKFDSACPIEYKRQSMLQFNVKMFTLDNHAISLKVADTPELWKRPFMGNMLRCLVIRINRLCRAVSILYENVKLTDACYDRVSVTILRWA